MTSSNVNFVTAITIKIAKSDQNHLSRISLILSSAKNVIEITSFISTFYR